jgi:hypothetical protein
VLARGRRGSPAAVVRGHELAESPHGHVVLVETKAADRRRVCLAGRAAVRRQARGGAVSAVHGRADGIVGPEVGSARHSQTCAAALALRAAVHEPRPARGAARRLGGDGPAGVRRSRADTGAAVRRCVPQPADAIIRGSATGRDRQSRDHREGGGYVPHRSVRASWRSRRYLRLGGACASRAHLTTAILPSGVECCGSEGKQ